MREAASSAAMTGATTSVGDVKPIRSLASSLKRVAEDTPNVPENSLESAGFKQCVDTEDSHDIDYDSMANKESVIPDGLMENESCDITLIGDNALNVCESIIMNPKEPFQKEENFRQKISDLILTIKKLEEDKDLYSTEMSLMRSSLDCLTRQLGESKQEEDKLKTQLALSAAREIEMKNSPDKIETKSRVSDLESQLNELMDTLEILTLDKEQLVMDNELLQGQITAGRGRGGILGTVNIKLIILFNSNNIFDHFLEIRYS